MKSIEKAGPLGGGLMVAGYGLTIIGFPEIGIPVAKVGAGVALASDAAEVINTFDEKGKEAGLKKAGEKFVFEAVGTVVKLPIQKAKTIKEIDKEILKIGVDLKIKLVEIVRGTTPENSTVQPVPVIVSPKK